MLVQNNINPTKFTVRKKSKRVVETSTTTMLKMCEVFSSSLHTETPVFLLNGREKIISIRPEYCDHSFVMREGLVYYRANVFNIVTKKTYFRDLSPKQMVKVAGR